MYKLQNEQLHQVRRHGFHIKKLNFLNLIFEFPAKISKKDMQWLKWPKLSGHEGALATEITHH